MWNSTGLVKVSDEERCGMLCKALYLEDATYLAYSRHVSMGIQVIQPVSLLCFVCIGTCGSGSLESYRCSLVKIINL
jgi:hypothetical protein